MTSGKTIEYVLQRKVHYLLRDGAYFEDGLGNVKGHLIDYEFKKLCEGQELLRTVDELDGDHGFNTVPPPEQKTAIYLRPFVNEEAGYVKDEGINRYPFEHAEKISIKMIRKKFGKPLTKNESVTLIIRTQ